MHLGVFEITHDLLVRDRAGFLFCFFTSTPLQPSVWEPQRAQEIERNENISVDRNVTSQVEKRGRKKGSGFITLLHKEKKKFEEGKPRLWLGEETTNYGFQCVLLLARTRGTREENLIDPWSLLTSFELKPQKRVYSLQQSGRFMMDL